MTFHSDDQPEMWVTRDGRVLFVCEMADDHLDNAIGYLGRRIRELEVMRAMLRKERNRRRPRLSFAHLTRVLNAMRKT